jgi:hypothetical protein
MAMFVHLAVEKRSAAIRRGGISRLRPTTQRPGGIFAMPVVRNFYISHQWLRELKRRNEGPIVGIYFRIPDTERVWVGHYGGTFRAMSADQAASVMMDQESREGWEVIIPRRIEPKEIHRVRRRRCWVGDISPSRMAESHAAAHSASSDCSADASCAKRTKNRHELQVRSNPRQ